MNGIKKSNSFKQLFKDSEIIFWDFDGVIKDSLIAKEQAFVDIFKDENKLIKKKIINHHRKNLGISRLKKIPIYLKYCNLKPSKKLVEKKLLEFAEIVRDRVVESSWIEGVEKFLKKNKKKKLYILCTATPKDEIKYILKKIKIYNYFDHIFGSELLKKDCVTHILKKYSTSVNKALFIGDSKTDYLAANKTNINFILIENKYNKALKKVYNLDSIKNYILYE